MASRVSEELERIESREKFVTLSFSCVGLYCCCCGLVELLGSIVAAVPTCASGSTKPRGAKSGIISAYVSATGCSEIVNSFWVGEMSGLGAVVGVSAGSALRFVPPLLELEREWEDDVTRPRGGVGTGGMPLVAEGVDVDARLGLA